MSTSPHHLLMVHIALMGFGLQMLTTVAAATAADPFVVLLPPSRAAATIPTCCNSSLVVNCSLAAINPAALATAAQSQLLLPNNVTANFSNIVPGSGGHSFHYVGRQTDVIISCNANRTGCHGHAMVASGQSYVLEFCGPASGHVWKQINVTGAREADAPVGGESTMTTNKRADHDRLVKAGIADNITMATYSIKFYYTASFAAVTPDVPGHVNLVLASINQGYVNSNVQLTAVLCKIEAATIDDVAFSSTLLANFNSMKASWELLRDSADVAFLLVNQYDSCGIAYFNVLYNGRTLASAMKSCSVGYYSPGHEVCHNVGCSHDLAFAGATPFPYAYGHLIAPGGYRTIMAYPNAAYATRVNYYSNPSVILPQTGTPTGETMKNNAALLTIFRMSLAAVGNESTCTAILPGETTPVVNTTTTTLTTTRTSTTISTTRTSTTISTTRTSTTLTTTRTSTTISTTRTSTTMSTTTPTTTRTSTTISTTTLTTTRTSTTISTTTLTTTRTSTTISTTTPTTTRTSTTMPTTTGVPCSSSQMTVVPTNTDTVMITNCSLVASTTLPPPSPSQCLATTTVVVSSSNSSSCTTTTAPTTTTTTITTTSTTTTTTATSTPPFNSVSVPTTTVMNCTCGSGGYF